MWLFEGKEPFYIVGNGPHCRSRKLSTALQYSDSAQAQELGETGKIWARQTVFQFCRPKNCREAHVDVHKDHVLEG
jgi:hypothetical protein